MIYHPFDNPVHVHGVHLTTFSNLGTSLKLKLAIGCWAVSSTGLPRNVFHRFFGI